MKEKLQIWRKARVLERERKRKKEAILIENLFGGGYLIQQIFRSLGFEMGKITWDVWSLPTFCFLLSALLIRCGKVGESKRVDKWCSYFDDILIDVRPINTHIPRLIEQGLPSVSECTDQIGAQIRIR